MAIGPVQLIVLGFDEPEFRGEILAELDRLKENDIVRVIDGLAVHKDAEGEVTVLKRTDLSDDEAAEFGATVGALIGLGVAAKRARKPEPSSVRKGPPRASTSSTRRMPST